MLSETYVGICHNRNNRQRRKYIEQQFTQIPYELNYNWDYLEVEKNIDRYVDLEVNWWDKKKFKINLKIIIINFLYSEMNLINRILYVVNKITKNFNSLNAIPIGQVSLILKHEEIIRNFLSSSTMKFCVIFEDDVIVKPESFTELEKLIYDLKELNLNKSIYIDLAGGGKIKIRNIYLKKYQKIRNLTKPLLKTGRTTCGYIINRTFAEEFLRISDTNKIPLRCSGSDFYYLGVIDLIKADVFWTIETLFEHGSELGVYESNFKFH